ncbi:DUF4920 domain-containing protein [Shewanella gelidii]|uniref:DUF4920 domain-containing protein n=1 Tax=Shewanella gelidii TaxID=1642821 RepID=A0A917JNC2_9GAMM|nr:DUF4920 domain-containing protein [Shewanella gelidii]MCL1097798.1 DUF4920 domain-containing protein [Shewanella gelidii]GGI78674.1 hypothetical protein GCM10009332_15100 [Shewanella gelidii]
MNKSKMMALAAVLSTSLLCQPLVAKDFGTPVNTDQLMAISTVLASPQQYVGQQVTVAGTIVGVCEKRGCWMELASDAKFEKLRIKVKDGDMVFPVSAKGSKAYATGTLAEIELSLEQTQKYLEKLAKRRQEQFDVSKVTESMRIYQLVPTGVSIAD